jgi:hypothetical protein
MNVYIANRVHTRDNPVRGEPTVFVQHVLDGSHGTRSSLGEPRPLAHIPFHSPDGIEWGYPGSGPADLALSILADYFEETLEQVLGALNSLWAPHSKAAALHQRFKADFLADEQRDEWQIRADVIDAWSRSPSVRACLKRLAEEDAELAESCRQDEAEHGTPA